MKIPFAVKSFIFRVTSIIVLLPGFALAHAHIKEMSPVKDAVVQTAPTEVVLKFSEALEPAMSKLEVTNLDSKEVVSLIANQPETDNSYLRVRLANVKNEKASFHVVWKAVTKDGHTVKGSYKFFFHPSVNK